MLTRIAFSAAGAAALIGPAAAQQPSVRPSPVTYDVKITPWPARPNSAVPPTSFTPPPAPFAAPAAPTAPVSTPTPAANSPSTRTLYYRKDTNAPVKPSAAAELTRPTIAAEPMPQPPRQPQPMQMPPTTGAAGTTGDDPLIPTQDRLFLLDSEKDFVKRMNDLRRVENEQRARLRNDPNVPAEKKKPLDLLEFPGHRETPGATFSSRSFVAQQEVIEPNFVCHRRLFFEDRNSERYGWTLGPLQPFAGAWKFFNDVQNLPYKFCSFPCLRHECSAGLCLPGDPVPMMIYPPALSVTGALAQAGVTVAAYFIIP